MATIKSTWIASHVGWGKLIGRISVGISQFSFTILDFCFLWVSCGGPRSHFQINLIKTLHLHFTSLWLYGFLLSLGIWHRKQIILRQVSSWSLNSVFSQVDTAVFTIYRSKPDDFSYFSLNFCLDRCREGYSFFYSLFSFQNLCVTLCLNSQKDCARPRREKKRNNFESWRWEKILGDESWRWEFELWNFRWVGERKE